MTAVITPSINWALASIWFSDPLVPALDQELAGDDGGVVACAVIDDLQ